MSSPQTDVLLRRLWGYIPPRHKFWFCVVFALAALAAFAEVLTLGALYPFMVVLVSPEQASALGLLRNFIELLALDSRRSLLIALTAGFILAVVIATVLRTALLLLQTMFVNRLGSALSIDVYRRTLHQPYQVHISRNSSEVISVISGKVNGVVSSVLMPVIVIGSSLIMLTAITVSLLAVQPWVAFGMLGGLGGIYALVAYGVKTRLDRAGRVTAEQGDLRIKALQEGLGGVRDILIDGSQEVFCKVFQDADAKARSASTVITFISNLPRAAIEGAGMVLIAGLAFMLAVSTDNPAGAIPILGVVALGAQRLLPVVQTLYASWGTLRGHTHALRDVLALLEQPVMAQTDKQLGSLPFDRNIHLNAVGFSYPNREAPVLQDVTLTIPKGARLGIIGATGSGKSTLIDILLGLLPVSSGIINIDDTTLDSSMVRRWQMRVAHVPQSIFLADATVAENIAFGLPRKLIDMERVRIAARKAQIDTHIEALPQGYETRIGERGIRMSGGQRQRIGIARALYKKADVLVLDEATSALDTQTESMVMESVEMLDKELTIIMIAHRLTTLRNCSMVIELTGGRISAAGSYEEVASGAKHQSSLSKVAA